MTIVLHEGPNPDVQISLVPYIQAFSLSTEWDAVMPFAPNSGHSFNVITRNISAETYDYEIKIYWLGIYTAGCGAVILPNGQRSCGSNVNMPSELGVYDLTARLWINGVDAGEFVVSEVEIGVVTGTTLEGQIHLQGRPDPPDDSWITPLTVTFIEGGTVVGTESIVTDDMGRFTINGINPGTYDICVKSPRALSNKRPEVSIVAGAITPVDFGTLREGDVNNDDVINIVDYGFLADAFGSVPGDDNWDDRCDFNRDGVINIVDFGLQGDNYGQAGDCWALV